MMEQLTQITRLNETELKNWYLGTPSTQLREYSIDELSYALEQLTPYERRTSYTKEMIINLIQQWIDNEETWEEYPLSRKEMFIKYKNMNGALPKIEIPTLRLFTYFIKVGALS